MAPRDMIAELIEDNAVGGYDGCVMHSDRAADAILKAMPDIIKAMVKPLSFEERRHGYHGSPKGYQVAHCFDDVYRVRFNNRVLCKRIKGYERAVEWANTHHTQQILKQLGIGE